MSKLGVVKAMQAAAFAKDWALFKSYFADQVYYRVGNVMEVKGPEAVAAYLRDLPSIGLTITRMDVRGAWETDSVAIAEYTMGGTRGDGQAVEYPCVDIYRFEGDKFIDWRVYAIEPMFGIDPGAVTFKRPTVASRGPEGNVNGPATHRQHLPDVPPRRRQGDGSLAVNERRDRQGRPPPGSEESAVHPGARPGYLLEAVEAHRRGATGRLGVRRGDADGNDRPGKPGS